jgi:hypothetical protein
MDIFESTGSASARGSRPNTLIIESEKEAVRGSGGAQGSSEGSSVHATQRPSGSNEGTAPERGFSSALSGVESGREHGHTNVRASSIQLHLQMYDDSVLLDLSRYSCTPEELRGTGEGMSGGESGSEKVPPPQTAAPPV